jgi:hypothetical protein
LNNDSWLSKNIPAILAMITILGVFFLLYLFTFTKNESLNKEIALLVLGVLSGSLTQVISYYFGSSSGSAKKDDIIGKNVEKENITNQMLMMRYQNDKHKPNGDEITK